MNILNIVHDPKTGDLQVTGNIDDLLTRAQLLTAALNAHLGEMDKLRQPQKPKEKK